MQLPLRNLLAAVIPSLLAIATALATIWIGERVLVIMTCVIAAMVIVVSGALLLNSQRILGSIPSPVIALAVVVSIALTNWPLRVAHRLSESSLNAIADRIRDGGHLDAPERAGAFLIAKAEVSPEGMVRLWTRVADGGNTGFVRTSADHLPINLWSRISLGDHWQFIAED